jgi:predicted enzyme related to lactoylglutathione lyase
MPDKPKSGAVIYAVNITRMREFYTNVTGLHLTYTEADNMILESDGMQLVIVKIPQEIAVTIEIQSPPICREDTPIKLIFPVPSIHEARSMAARYGGELNSAEKEWSFQGNRVCDGHDPEGNVFEVRESEE